MDEIKEMLERSDLAWKLADWINPDLARLRRRLNMNSRGQKETK